MSDVERDDADGENAGSAGDAQGAAVGAGAGADPGGPGGMGGVRGRMPNPDHRPNGGVSPIQSDADDDDGA